MSSRSGWSVGRSLVFVGFLVPAVVIFYLALANLLGAEPAKALVELLGETALIVLILTLSITPLRKIRRLPSFVGYRRMLGLYAFFYALLHVVSYAVFLVDWQNFVEDLYKRPYIVVGAAAFLILFALAITSTKAAIRRLGKNWKRLHRLVYLAAIAIVVHVYWQTRSDYFEALVFAVIIAILLLSRVAYSSKRRSSLVVK